MLTCSIWWSQIIRDQRLYSLPPPWLGPSYKAHYPIQPSHCTLNPRVTVLPSGSNKSFFSTCGVVFIQQYLTFYSFLYSHLFGKINKIDLESIKNPETREGTE
jgi:hypothetical protein